MLQRNMLNVLMTLALLSLAPLSDAALLMPREDAFLARTDEGKTENNISLQDRNQITSLATQAFDKLLRARSMTKFPDGDGKTVSMKGVDKLVTATSSPNSREKMVKTLFNNPLKTLPSHTDGQDETPPVTIAGSLKINPSTQSFAFQQQPKLSSFLGLSKRINSNKRLNTSTPGKQFTLDPVKDDSGTRQELVKMLNSLEELHKLMNSTLSSRITMTTRGNGSGRFPGKKSKMAVLDGGLKSTTATTLDSSRASQKVSTDQMDSKLHGKSIKKSFSSAPKKNNKRVCFWKYCSQN